MTGRLDAAPTVVVTGAAGFIGSHLVDALLAAGHNVTGLDRRSPLVNRQAAANLEDASRHPSFRLAEVDLLTDELANTIAGAETVFHLAAVPGVRASWDARFDQYASANIIGTHRLLTACEEAKVRRLVYASSSRVPGRLPQGLVVRRWSAGRVEGGRPGRGVAGCGMPIRSGLATADGACGVAAPVVARAFLR